MSGTTVRNIASLPAYDGPHAIPGIRFRAARAALGVSAWGMNVLELDPGVDGHPRHDHSHDGQEELYVVLEGSVTLQAGEEEHVLVAGDMARVPPATTRQLITRDQGATVLAIGATPGAAFSPTPGM